MPDVDALADALRKADAAGNTEDAKKLAQAIQQMRGKGPAAVAKDVGAAATELRTKAPDMAEKLNAELGHTGKGYGQDAEGVNSPSPGIDRAGLPFGMASAIMGGDTPKERELALQKFDPKAKLSTDWIGRDVVTLGNGKQVYVEPYGKGLGGKLAAEVKTIGEQARARPLETAGMVAGGAMGGIGGAALVGGGGYLADQVAKKIGGTYSKTPGQLAAGTGESAVGGALGEGVARIPGALIKGGLPSWITGATPETKEFGSAMLKRGVTPAYAKGSPGLASAEWKMNLAKKLGLPENDKRVEAMSAEITDYLAKHGVGADKAAGTIAATQGGGAPRLGGEAQYGQALKAPLEARKAQLEQALAIREEQNKLLDQNIATARNTAETEIKKLQTGQGTATGDFKGTVADDIRAARKAVSDKATANYTKLAQVEGDLQVDMSPISVKAKEILANMPKDRAGNPILMSQDAAPSIEAVKQLANLPPNMPIADAAHIRTQLGAMIKDKGLLPPTKSYLLGELHDSADAAIKGAGGYDPTGRNVVASTMRSQIEKEYAADMKRMTDGVANRLVRQAGKTGSVDSQDVIPVITRNPAQFSRIWGLLQPEAQRRVGRGLFDNMVAKATKGGQISGQDFLDQLDKYRPILDRVYGKDAPRMYRAARALQAIDGKIPLDSHNARLMPENVVQALETAAATEKKMDQFFDKNALASLAPGTAPGNVAAASAKKEVAEAALARQQITPPAEPMSDTERTAMKDRIREAGNTVGATPDKRIELQRERIGTAKQAVQDFDHDYFGKMADPKFLHDEAVDHIIQPKKEELLNKAVALYGPGSDQVKALQEAFLRKAVASLTRDTSDPKRAFGGQGVRDFLSQYTPKQKETLLAPYGGEEGLKKLARFADFAFPASTSDVSAGLAAGGEKSKMGPGMVFSTAGWGNLLKYGKSYFTGFILSKPAMYKLLVQGFEPGPAGVAARKTLDNAMRVYVQTSTANTKP